MHDLAVTAIGRDRPGIVAAVTKVLYSLGCNLADCSMSLLRGQFAMILLIEAPDDVDREKLEEALRGPAADLDLVTTVGEVVHMETGAPSRPFVVSIYGADRPGIVHKVSKSLADTGVNITNLASHLVDEAIYTMVLEIDLPAEADPGEIENDLRAIAEELQVDLSFRSSEADSL